MHTEVKVIKEARRQLEKAGSWVAALSEIDHLDTELIEEWAEQTARLVEHCNAAIEGD